MKYYIALAINKKDPNDIWGLCENSFSMSWERNRANLFTPPNMEEKYYHIPMRKFFKDKLKQGWKTEIFKYGWNGEDLNVKGLKNYMKKRLTDLNYKYYHACGRTVQEYEWHWCQHYAIRCSRFLDNKQDYEIRCFRVNSKYCPVRVDLSVREGMSRKKIEYNKYEWRNANFVLKSAVR